MTNDYEKIKKSSKIRGHILTAIISLSVFIMLAVVLIFTGIIPTKQSSVQSYMMKDLGIKKSEVTSYSKENNVDTALSLREIIKQRLIAKHTITEDIVNSYVPENREYAYVKVWANLNKDQAKITRDAILEGQPTDTEGESTVVSSADTFALSAFKGVDLFISSSEDDYYHTVVKVEQRVKAPDNYAERLTEATKMYGEFLYTNYENEIVTKMMNQKLF